MTIQVDSNLVVIEALQKELAEKDFIIESLGGQIEDLKEFYNNEINDRDNQLDESCGDFAQDRDALVYAFQEACDLAIEISSRAEDIVTIYKKIKDPK